MEKVLDSNSFFSPSLDRDAIHRRILELEKGKVGLYSVGLYPASLAYNCAMQKNSEGHLLLAPRCFPEIFASGNKLLQDKGLARNGRLLSNS